MTARDWVEERARRLLRDVAERTIVTINGVSARPPLEGIGEGTVALVERALREAERRGMERAAGVCEEWASKAVLNHGARWFVGRCVERIRSLIADDTEGEG